MLPDDFDREAICRSISDGIYRAFTDSADDPKYITSDSIMTAIKDGVREAIMDIMNPMAGHPITRDDALEMIKEGTAEAMEKS